MTEKFSGDCTLQNEQVVPSCGHSENTSVNSHQWRKCITWLVCMPSCNHHMFFRSCVSPIYYISDHCKQYDILYCLNCTQTSAIWKLINKPQPDILIYPTHNTGTESTPTHTKLHLHSLDNDPNQIFAFMWHTFLSLVWATCFATVFIVWWNDYEKN